jgi:O-antigen/teichoic acid export membrane protein
VSKSIKINNKENSNTLQAFWIAIGSLFSFGFGIVSSMILSRYFPKDDYGTYKQVIYVYTTLLTVFTLGLPKAFSYFLPRVPENQAKNVIKKITNLFFLLGALFSILLYVLSPQIASFLKNSDLELAIKIFSPVPFLMLPTMGLEGILSTFRMTKFMAVYTICTRILMLLCVAIPVIFFNTGYKEAIIGFVIASFITFLLAIYFKYLPVKTKGNDIAELNYKEIFKFSLPLLTASLWGVLLKSTDQFFISRYFGTEAFAEFSNGNMDLPFIGMIVGATATVLSPIFAKIHHEKLDPKTEIFPLWMSTFKKSAMLIYPLLIFSMFFAKELMIVLYGNKYVNSGYYYQIYNIYNFFSIIVFAPLIINTGKVKFYKNVHMYSAILLIVLEYTSVLLIQSSYWIVIISTVVKIGMIIIMLLFISKIFKTKLHHLFPWKPIVQILIPSILILIGIKYILIKYLDLSHFYLILIAFTSYLFIFMSYSHVIGLNYISIVKPILNKINRKK